MPPEHRINITTTSPDPEVSIINLHHRRRNSTALFSSSSSASSTSATASVNRSSFASDFPDRDSSASDSNQHLSGRGSGGETSSGLDLERDKCFTGQKPNCGFGYKRDYRDRVQKQGSQSAQLEIVEDLSTNSKPVLFSSAVKDCQDRRCRDDEKGYKRNISLEIKSASPRLEASKKDSLPSRFTSNIPSPGTPTYQFPSVSMQKGWNSERMALPLKGNRVGPALLPLRNVKALPSKWEDAERWIFSPAYGDSSYRQPLQNQYHRKPKAKSGPLGPSGSAYYTMHTPVLPMSDRRSVGSDIMGDSPFSEGLAVKKGLSATNEDLRKGSPARLDPWMPRSVSLRGCSVERPGQSSVPSSDVSADEKVNLSCPQSRRDIAMQMSSSDSANSSFKRISSSQNKEQSHSQSSFSKMRYVEMDEKLTIGSLRNIHKGNQSGRSSRRVKDSTTKTIVPQSTTWGCKETAIGIGKSTSDESRIIAWENLQKEKADAAIQKLEMKLEKKKASSMNKIMKKLKSAQKKAIEMRMYMLSNQLNQPSKSSGARSSSTSKVRHRSSLSGCFTCHAFELP